MQNKLLLQIPILIGFYIMINSCKVLPYYTADVIVQNLMTAESLNKIYTIFEEEINNTRFDSQNYLLKSQIAISGFHLKGNGIETLRLKLDADDDLDRDTLKSSKEYSVISVSWFGDETISLKMFGKRVIEYAVTEIPDETESKKTNTLVFLPERPEVLIDLEYINLGSLELAPNTTTLVSYYMNPHDKDNRLEITDDLSYPRTVHLKFPEDDTKDPYIADYIYEKDTEGWTITINDTYASDKMIFSLIQLRVKKL